MTYAATEDQEARVVQGMWEEGRLVTEGTAEEEATDAPAEATDTPEPPAEATGDGAAAEEGATE
jgi:hypothetical protein